VAGGSTDGSRAHLAHGELESRPSVAQKPNLPDNLTWTTSALESDLDLVGDFEVRLDAAITESDTGWIVALEDMDDKGSATCITPGWLRASLRASLRAVDDAVSDPGRPLHDCSSPVPVPPGETTTYRVALVPNAMRILAGHRLALTVGSSDSTPHGVPAPLGFTHLDVGGPSINTVFATSTLLLPVLTEG